MLLQMKHSSSTQVQFVLYKPHQEDFWSFGEKVQLEMNNVSQIPRKTIPLGDPKSINSSCLFKDPVLVERLPSTRVHPLRMSVAALLLLLS
jgi:hypothetical protein